MGSASPEEVNRILDNNLVAEFHRLEGAPGVQLRPTSWTRVQQLVAENSTESLGRLGRSPGDIHVYRQFREKLQQEYCSTADYVRIRVLGYACETAPDGRKLAGQEPAEEPAPIWRLNDFPYHLEPGIEHHNIWCRRPLSDAEIAQVIAQNREGWECVYFINPFPLASIPSVWHAHVMSRRCQ